MSSTLKIFGCSDKINELNLPALLSTDDSLGLNHFPFLGAKTKYMLWMDEPVFGNCVFIDNESTYKPYLKFIPNFEDNNHKGLFGAYTVATFAIDFAIKEGYSKVELYGILDGTYKPIENDHIEYTHFYNDVKHIMHKANLQSWKDEIMRYNYNDNDELVIDIKIPYLTV